MANKYTRLDDNGLLFLLQQIKAKIDASAVTIDTTISADSTNANVPGSKAVYDFVTKAIANIKKFHAEIHETLPEVGDESVLYLIPKSKSESGNIYDEYMYINGAWESFDGTNIDLSGYVQASEMHAITNTEITAIVNQVWS